MTIVIITYILFSYLIVYFFHKKLLHPIPITLIYWLTIIFISEMNHFIFKIKIYHAAIIPVIVFLLSFLIGGMLYYYKNKSIKPQFNFSTSNRETQYLNNLLFVIILFSILGLLSLYIQLKYLNIKITSFNDIYKIANKIAILRYSNQTELPGAGKLLQAFLYAGSYFGGYTFYISKKLKHKLLTFLPLTTITLISIINSVKLPFIVSIFFWLSSFISTYIFYKQGKVCIKIKYLFTIIICSIFFITTFITIHKFRSGDSNTKYNYESLLISYYSSYNVFSLWWKNYDFSHKITPGKYTFSGIHNLIFKDRQPGLFTEFIILKENPIVKSNVYTIFRAFIEDYSFFGTIIIFFFCGYLFTASYEKLLNGYFLAHISNSFFLTNLFWSIVTFVSTYNTIILSWLLVIIFFFILNIQIHKKDKHKIKLILKIN